MEEGSHSLIKPSKSSFLKVLIGDFATKLRIPLLFVYRFPNVIPKRVTLISASSKTYWVVEIEEDDSKELCFKTGWKKFAEDNGLESGEFIVFKYDGNSTFKVKIYGKSACEKEPQSLMGNYQNYSDAADDAGMQDQKETRTRIRQQNQKEKHPIDENGRTRWKRDDEIKQEKADSDDYGNINQERRQSVKEAEEESNDVHIRKTGEGKYERPMQKAFSKGRKVDSKNPSFRVLLKQVSAEKGTLCIPTEFLKHHMTIKRQKVELETSKGVWTVTLLPHTKRNSIYARLSAGWTDFARDNHLKAGETLVFTMIQRSDCPKFIVYKLRK